MQKYSEGKTGNLYHRYHVWITLVLGISLFIFLISRVSFAELLDVLSRAKIQYMIAALGAGVVPTFFRAFRYVSLLPIHGRWLNIYGAFALMRFLNFVMPFRSGEIVFLKLLKKYHLSPSIAETLPVLFLMRITDVAALTMLFIVGMSMVSFNTTFESTRRMLIYISVGFVVITLCLPVLMPLMRPNLSNKWLAERFNAFQTGIIRIKGIPIFMRTLALAVLIWMSMVIFNIFAQLAFDTPLNFFQCFVVSVIVLAVSMLPIHAPLAIGTGDAAWVGVMVMFGVGTPQAIGLAIGVRLVSVLMIIIDSLIGGYFLRMVK